MLLHELSSSVEAGVCAQVRATPSSNAATAALAECRIRADRPDIPREHSGSYLGYLGRALEVCAGFVITGSFTRSSTVGSG